MAEVRSKGVPLSSAQIYSVRGAEQDSNLFYLECGRKTVV